MKKNVLVAEDNAISQMLVNQTLLKLGASVDIAADGDEAIEKFKKNKYDLILMDLQMPLMDGYECATYIRNQLKSNIPIIGMTASDLNGEDKKCYECGMNDCISKPITIENLNRTFQRILLAPSEINLNPHILVEKNISVDLTMLYDISGNDESYIVLMVQTFLENMPNTIIKMRQCLSDENWEGLYQGAHYGKSTLSVVKVNEMFDAVVAIEGCAKSRSYLEKLPSLLQKVEESFVIAKEVLIKKFNERSISIINK